MNNKEHCMVEITPLYILIKSYYHQKKLIRSMRKTEDSEFYYTVKLGYNEQIKIFGWLRFPS